MVPCVVPLKHCDALAFLNSISESFTNAKPECFTMFPVVEAEERVPEERFENAGDGVCNEDWSANELPVDLRHDMLQQIPKEIRRQVRKAHVGLGHPSRTTFSPHDEARWGFSCCVGIRKGMAVPGLSRELPTWTTSRGVVADKTFWFCKVCLL